MAKTATQIERASSARKDVVEVRRGEYVSATAYRSLGREEKARLKEVGADVFNQEKRAEVAAKYVQLTSGEYVLRSDFEALTSEQQVHLQAVGIEQFTADQEAERAEFVANHVELDFKDTEGNNEWIAKEDWNKLTTEEQGQLKELGVDAFNEAWEATHVELDYAQEGGGESEWVTKENWDKLTPEQQEQLMTMGVTAFNADQEQKQATFEATHVEVGEDDWVTKENWDALTPEQQAELKELGTEAFNVKNEAELAKFEAANVKLDYVNPDTGGNEWVSKENFNALTETDQKKLMLLGVEGFNEYKSKRYISALQFDRLRINTLEQAYLWGVEWWGLTREQVDRIRAHNPSWLGQYGWFVENDPLALAIADDWEGFPEGTREYETVYDPVNYVEVLKGDLPPYLYTDSATATVDVTGIISTEIAPVGTEPQPGQVTAEAAFAQLKLLGKIPQNATIQSYDPDTRVFVFEYGSTGEPSTIQSVASDATATKLRDLGCASIDKETGKEVFNLALALEKGVSPSELETAFGKEAVDEAQAVRAALAKLEKAGGSPIWALINNYMTEKEVILLFGEEGAAPFLDAERRWNEAEATKKEAAWYDLPARAMATFTTIQILTGGAAEYMTTKYLSPLMETVERVQERAEAEATGDIRQAAIISGYDALKVPLGFGAGVLMHMAGLTSLVSFVAGIPSNVTDKEYYTNFGTNLVNGFKSLGATIAADPAFGVPMAAGLFLGPEGTVKLFRSAGARLDPYYIENIGTRYGFTTGKLPLGFDAIAKAIKEGKITEVDVANAARMALDRLMKNPTVRATASIGKSNLKLKVFVETTPVAKWMGGALWRSSPIKDPYSGLTHIVNVTGKEPALFFSTQAAPRFAMSSAHGVPATSPCLILVYTKNGGLRWYPTSIQYANSLAQMKNAGFNYLGSGRAPGGAYGPIKAYGGAFENEAMLPNGMKIFRVQNLRSRILGAGAGEFVTTYNGWVMPIYRFAEAGANVPSVSIANLAAMRIASIIHALRVLVTRPRGFGAEVGYARVGQLASTLDQIGRAAAAGLYGSAAMATYNRAVEVAMREKLTEVYDSYDRAKIERAWRADPSVYETAYLNSVARLSATAGRSYVDPRTFEPDSSYATVRVDRRGHEVDDRLTGVRDGRPPIDRDYRVDRPIRPDLPTPRTTGRGYPPIRATREAYVLPPKPPLKQRPPKGQEGKREEEERRLDVPAGTYTWRQGALGWRSVPPPYDAKKPLFTKLPPVGARTGGRTPAETIQVINPTGREPKSLTVDLGVTDITITDPLKPTIRFTGRGMKTDVGKRIIGPEKGLSLGDETAGLSLDEEPTEIPEMTLNAPPRRSQVARKPKKKNRLSWLDRVGTVKGYRAGDF